MENITKSPETYSKYLPIIDKYFKIVVIAGLCWAVKYQTSKSEDLQKEKDAIYREKEQVLREQINALLQIKQNNDEIFEKYINKIANENKDGYR